MQKIIEGIFSTPRIVGVIGDANSGKSNFIYSIISKLKKDYDFELYSYGLRNDLGEKKIYSVNELEQIKNSIIIIDEMTSLFDLEDRRKRKLVERTLRLIFHNNNILVLVGLPENMKKFVSSKLDVMIYFKSTIADFINGSKAKKICMNYCGIELGSSVLELEPSEAIIYNKNYTKIKIEYFEKFDTKKGNCSILCSKKDPKKGEK